jgi:hypothetical protein
MILDIEKDSKTGDVYLLFPKELIESTGWKEGENLVWKISTSGEVTLSKAEKKLILVKKHVTTLVSYFVEVPSSFSKSDVHSYVSGNRINFDLIKCSENDRREIIFSENEISRKDATFFMSEYVKYQEEDLNNLINYYEDFDV